MGNLQLHRNKDFQSVVPEDGPVVLSTNKKIRSPTSKTAPAPDGEKFVYTNDFPIIDRLPTSTSTIIHDVGVSRSNVTPVQPEPFDFKQTESQLRRKGMADCEFECSQITSYLFVGGYHVAGNWDLLKSNGITRVVNCSSAVVDNHFINDPSMTYLSINMYDGRQDDIFWFVCDIIQFILKARSLNEKVLIHCEKGVSRSCSFAIAYRMWSAGEKWKTAFEYVKLRRAICAPNTAFTCNLIEIGEILSNEVVTHNMLFRTAFHLPHDPLTAVLKLCRNTETRKIIVPATSLLDPKGVFVIRATDHDTNNQLLFLWRGDQSSSSTFDKARLLVVNLKGIVTNVDEIAEESQGKESALFLSHIINDGPFGLSSSSSSPVYDDLYDNKPSMEAAMAFQKEHDQMRISRDCPQAVRESSIKGFETYPEMDSIRKQLSNRELSIRDMDANHPGKISRIPSLKMGTESRRTSHSKVALIGSSDHSGKLSRQEDVASKASSGSSKINPTNSKDIGEERKPVVKLDLSSVGSAVPHALQLGSLPQLDESPAPSSRRDSVSNDDTAPPLSSRATSLMLPRLAEAVPVNIASASPQSPDLGSARRSLIDKIADAIGSTPEKSHVKNEQHLVDHSLTSTSGAAVKSTHPKVPMLVAPASAPPLAVLSADSLKSDKDDSNDVRPPEMSALSSARSASRIPTAVGPDSQAKTSAHEEEVMLRSPSKLRMLSFLVGGGSESRSSAIDGSGLFRSSSRIAPLPSGEETERKLSTTTDSTQTMSRLASPSSLMTRDDSKQMIILSPAAQHKTNSSSSSNAILTPIPGLLMRTPSTDRHPDHVGLSRGPTPAEELVVNSNRDAPIIPGTQTTKNKGAAITKPTLYQVISRENRRVSRSSRKDAPRVQEWQAMGVYDDEDLAEGCVLLLLCPEMPNFLWIGNGFDFSDTGVDPDGCDDDGLLRWAASVLSGEVQSEDSVGKNLSHETLSINRSGEESDAFWTAFNDGY